MIDSYAYSQRYDNILNDYGLLNLTLRTTFALESSNISLLSIKYEHYRFFFLLTNLFWFFCCTLLNLYIGFNEKKGTQNKKTTPAALINYSLAQSASPLAIPGPCMITTFLGVSSQAIGFGRYR